MAIRHFLRSGAMPAFLLTVLVMMPAFAFDEIPVASAQATPPVSCIPRTADAHPPPDLAAPQLSSEQQDGVKPYQPLDAEPICPEGQVPEVTPGPIDPPKGTALFLSDGGAVGEVGATPATTTRGQRRGARRTAAA
jgi:hypothetical protein